MILTTQLASYPHSKQGPAVPPENKTISLILQSDALIPDATMIAPTQETVTLLQQNTHTSDPRSYHYIGSYHVAMRFRINIVFVP